jgi:cytochrome c-type biogenesis protein CcmH/NrfF
MATETFTKESIREQHKRKITEILQQGGSIEDLVNYIMSRIGDVISYERRKYERRLMREWSKNQYERERRRSSASQ